MNFESGKNREEKIDKFLDNLGWYFHQKETPTGVHNAICKISSELDIFNKNMEKSNESSERLTRALNRITLAGAIIAGLGVLIAGLNFVFEYLIKK